MGEHMAAKITVYQKPSCSKCRTTLRLLEEKGVEFKAIDYYARPLTAEQLRGLLSKLGLSPRDILRKDEPIARELGLNGRELADEALIDLMVANPDLIQRPIVVRGDDAVLGRPPENIEKLL
jgi:arsenate reductase (glutaredoxin)